MGKSGCLVGGNAHNALAQAMDRKKGKDTHVTWWHAPFSCRQRVIVASRLAR